jgi:hypothetical protein
LKKPPPRKSKGGRPKGSKTAKTVALETLLSQRLPDVQLLELLIDIAKGTRREVLNGRGQVVTIQDPPDGATARYLADRKWGRVPQPVSGDADGPPVAVRLVVSSVGIPLGK